MTVRPIAIILGVLLGVLGLRAAQGQSRWLDLQARLARADSSDLEEKVYLQTDHDSYICGQVLWISAYVLEARTHRPVDFSRVLYVELLDAAQHPVWQRKLALSHGRAEGSFEIPFSLTTGTYVLRAYTSQMENHGARYFFMRPLAIVNTTRVLPVQSIRDSGNCRLEIYPEGGTFVEGKSQLLAYQFLDEEGRGLPCQGELLDLTGRVLATLSSDSEGMGTFRLTPQPGVSYQLRLSAAHQPPQRFPLPQPRPCGYQIHLSGSPSAGWTLLGSSSTPDGHHPDAFVLVHQREHVEFAAMLSTDAQGNFRLNLPKDSLSAGVSELTVFDAQLMPVCGRLIYLAPPSSSRLPLKLTRGSATADPRSEVSLNLNVQEAPGDTSWCTVSVYRAEVPGSLPIADIASYMWLESDLGHALLWPALPGSSAMDSAWLEHVLLTRGYRSYRNPAAFGKEAPLLRFTPELTGPVVRVRAQEPTGKAVDHVPVYFSLPGRQFQFQEARTDSNGIARFYPRPFYGDHQLVLQPDPNLDSSVRLDLLDPFYEKPTQTLIPQLHVDSSWRSCLSEAQRSMSTQKAYEPRWYNRIELPKKDSLPFFGPPDKSYHLDNYTRYTTLEEVLREYVAEVNPRFKHGLWHFYMFDAAAFAMDQYVVANTVFQNDPLVLLDGVPIFNLNRLMRYDPLNLSDLDLADRHYYYGSLSMDGIMSFRTYHGNLKDYVLNSHALVLDYPGLELRRRFPDIAHDRSASDIHLPDFRQLLYWNPELAIPASAPVRLRFFTGDLKGAFRIVVQGVDRNGRLGSASQMLLVK